MLNPPVAYDPRRRPHLAMTSQGSARTQFSRALQRRNLMGAEMAMREMRSVTLLEALDYLELLAELRPDRANRAGRSSGKGLRTDTEEARKMRRSWPPLDQVRDDQQYLNRPAIRRP